MSIMDLFKSQPAPAQPSTVPADKGLSEPNPSTTPDGKMPGSEGTPVNPLDAYSKMFENAAKNTGTEAPSFKLDPKVLGEVSSTMDFTKGVDPALMEKAMAGDPKAILAAMQSVARNAYSASLEHTTALTETHLGQRAKFEQERVNSGVREQLTSSALAADSPNYSHPVVKAELNRVASQFAKANPDASPQEVAQAAKRYIEDLSSALRPDVGKEQSENAAGEMDWSKYLS